MEKTRCTTMQRLGLFANYTLGSLIRRTRQVITMDYASSKIGRDWNIADCTHLYSSPLLFTAALYHAHALLNTSRYWLVTSVTISSSDLSSRPRTFSAFEASEIPGLDFFVPVAGT
jgi:hypothetical protein